MAITLNLLPQDKIVSGTLAKFLKITKSLGVISLAVFIIYSVGVSILIFLNSSEISKLTDEGDNLKSQITQLESSEQQIVLIKDRIKKIETVKSLPSSLENLVEVISLLGNLTERSRVTELDVDSKKADLTVNFKSNFEMTSFIDLVKNSSSFKSVNISTFGLNPVSGYLVSFSFTGS